MGNRCFYAVAIAAAISLSSASEAATPNIVLILADDLGYGDVGCFGQQRIQTPRLDQLAAEGMRLTDFYAGSTVCAPSRCVLMTGYHTGHCYIRGNARLNLQPEHVTIAEVLHQAGYQTGMFGKWGLGHEEAANQPSTGVPTRQGFDRFYGYLDQRHAHNYYPTFLISNEQRVKLDNVSPDENEDGSGVARKQNQYSHDVIVDQAMDWLRKVGSDKSKPFFLYLPITLPHANNEARNKGMEVPELGDYANLDWPEPQKGHAAMITRMDRDIGKIIDLLEELGQAENTFMWFSSDNGPHREGGNDPDFNDSNGPLRGIKRDLYEGGIRVPTIVSWPSHVPAGKVSDHIGYNGDLFATCCELAGVAAPTDLDSVSFLPVVTGRQSEQKQHKYLYWEFYEQGSKQAVRMGKWKGVAQPFGGPIELYDLSVDIGETNNIAADHPDIVKQIERAMAEAHVPSADWQLPKQAKQRTVSAATK